MKILIIGAKGFIGSHCVDYFSAQGHEVSEADITPSTQKNYTQLSASNTDFNILFAKQNFDLCINGSGAANVGFSFENPAKDFELNVLNVNKLLVAIRQYSPKCRFINFSSAAVYGNPVQLPITEKSNLKPLSPYGFHKLQSEYLLTEYYKFFGIHTCSLRIFSAYGPRLRKQLFWDLYKKFLNADSIELFGSGEESRDFIYIDDLIQTVDLVIQKAKFEGDLINIASGIETTIKEAATSFYTLLDPSLHPTFSGKVKVGDPNNWRADIGILKDMGFSPKYTIQEGLSKYIKWLKEEKLD
jgi:dTDP-glucose 4,6-dehydratase/UDP-glucose 4-epimerase